MKILLIKMEKWIIITHIFIKVKKKSLHFKNMKVNQAHRKISINNHNSNQMRVLILIKVNQKIKFQNGMQLELINKVRNKSLNNNKPKRKKILKLNVKNTQNQENAIMERIVNSLKDMKIVNKLKENAKINNAHTII